MALITDGRFSGGSYGFVIGHVAPEAQVGGPIGLLREGDIITIDSETQEISFQVTEEELTRPGRIRRVARTAAEAWINRTSHLH